MGILPEGLIMKKVRLSPNTTKVIGGGQIVNRISTLYTEKVQLENLQESGQITVGLALEPASLKIADGSKNKVDVFYTLEKRKP